MKMSHSTVVAWIAVLAAVIAWTGVCMYAGWISAQLDAQSVQTTDAQSASAKETAASRFHLLARDTQNLRTQLDSLTHTDVIGFADTIDSLGKIAGVTLRIGGATPESAGGKRPAATKPVLQAVGFVVEAEGTFSSLMHAAALLETLPSLSALQSLELEHLTSSVNGHPDGSTQWHLTAHIRMLTSVDISS